MILLHRRMLFLLSDPSEALGGVSGTWEEPLAWKWPDDDSGGYRTGKGFCRDHVLPAVLLEREVAEPWRWNSLTDRFCSS